MITLKTITIILLVKALSAIAAIPTPKQTQASIVAYVGGAK